MFFNHPPPFRDCMALLLVATLQHVSEVRRSARAPPGLSAWSCLGFLCAFPSAGPSYKRGPTPGHQWQPWASQAANPVSQWLLVEVVTQLGVFGSKVQGTPGVERFSCRCWALGESGLQELSPAPFLQQTPAELQSLHSCKTVSPGFPRLLHLWQSHWSCLWIPSSGVLGLPSQ